MRVVLLSHAASGAIAAPLLARGHAVTFFGAGAMHGALLKALDGHDGCLLLGGAGAAPEFGRGSKGAGSGLHRKAPKLPWRRDPAPGMSP